VVRTLSHRSRLLAALSAALLLIILFLPANRLARPADALDNGLARTPPMGWNSWNAFRCRIDERLIREMADAMVQRGMRDAGYQFLVVDDCWQTARSADGLIHASTRTFPSGMAALGAYIHQRGLKFGIYTSAGSKTCQGRAGSRGFEHQDAATYAAWGVDYIKVDWCFSEGLDATETYARWRDAIAATGRPMLLSVTEWGTNNPAAWAPQVGNLWRTSTDIYADWGAILHNLDTTAHQNWAAGPGHWADADMLEVGNGQLTLDENKAHFSMWALLASPLMAGNDLRTMDSTIGAILTNHELIAVNQDLGGTPGNIVDDTGTGLQVWARPLADGSRAVALLNRTDSPATITARWEKIGLPPGGALVRDLWEHADLGPFDGAFTTAVPARGVVIVRITPLQVAPPAPVAPPAAPLGDVALSDLPALRISNGFGPAERDRSNGESAEGDGRPLSLNGQIYARGLGVHAPFEASYALQGRCARLSAVLGVDDEAGTHGAVAFQVWGDDRLLYESGPLNGDAPPLPIDIDIGGVQILRLVVTDGGDWTDYDHADWADATLRCPS
jgi:alpha-galactosidase